MSLGGFTLADRLGAKTIPCRVRGCDRTRIELGSKAVALGAGRDRTDGTDNMCEPCATKFVTLQDKPRRCDAQGCKESWIWSVDAQIQAFATRQQPPRILCSSCDTKYAALKDQQVDCAVPGCTRHAVVTRKTQLLTELAVKAALSVEPLTVDPVAAEGPPPGEILEAEPTGAEPTTDNPAVPAPKGSKKVPRAKVTFKGLFCEPCREVSKRIADRSARCGINQCKRSWIWKADEQIQAFAAGKPNEPPRRMCDGCRASFGKLLDRQVRCRTSGCKETWTWSRFDQLDACVADKAPPKAPHQMCEKCWTLFDGLKDVERPCRRPGCKHTWTDKRGAQLARAARGKTGDPYPQYCEPCKKDMGELEDREVGCKTDGCSGTWTWSKDAQLAAGVVPETHRPEKETKAAPVAPVVQTATGDLLVVAPPTPEGPVKPGGKPGEGKRRRNRDRNRRRQVHAPARMCHACVDFLKDRKTLEIPCSACATPIFWPPESQLQSHLGNWATPGLCGACKRDATEAARKAAREEIVRQAMEVSAAAHAGASDNANPVDTTAPAEPANDG